MPRFEPLHLLHTEFDTDALLQQVPREVVRTILCKETSVSATEWASAGTMGLRPEFRLKVHPDEFRGEATCRYKDRVYLIYRAYGPGSDGYLELYLGTRVGVT